MSKTRRITWTIRSGAVVALVAAALSWGCGDTAFDPSGGGSGLDLARGGHHSGGGGGGGTSGTLTVDATGAVVTSGAVVLSVSTDSKRKLGAGANSVSVAWNFAATQAAALADLDGTDGTPPGLDHCFVDGNRGDPVPEARIRNALSKLVDAAQDRALNLSVDKTALGTSSADHNIGGSWQETDGPYDLGVGTIMKVGDPATVTMVSGSIDSGTSEIRYSGGSVNVKDRTQSASFSVFCPNLDVVDVVLTR